MNKVVTLSYPNSYIAQIIMEDRTYKNTFSQELIQGLVATFNKLRDDTKVVIIQGYENYFCCGGTQEELLDIYKGKITFADLTFYRLLLDCEVPTIAAMQGHAVGGGLAFGCYADLMVLGEECLYSANFMKYGFTPGMGSTYVIPKKFGEILGCEMLFSAKNYYGGELKQRGVAAIVVKKQEVLLKALKLARELIDKPLSSLKILKQHLTRKIKVDLPFVIEQELAMHAITFKQTEVKQRIEALFKN